MPVKEYDMTPEGLLLPFPECDLPFPLEEHDDATETQSPDQVIPFSEERSIVTF
jgi:hypothetical protein